jgi:CRISPR/Cas system-associated exonuclease Cas4 (RecB family)
MASPAIANALGAELSPSQVSRFLSCSASYWFKYGLGLPEPATAQRIRGKVVHRLVAAWFTAKRDGCKIDATLDDVFEAEAAGAELEPSEASALRQESGELAGLYIREVGEEIEPAEVEQPISGTIAGVKVRGIVDLIDVNGDVIDLKVSSRKPSTPSADYRFQVATYRAIAPAAAGSARVDTLVAKKAPELVSLAVDSGAADRRMVERLYPHVQEGIREGLFYPNRSHMFCTRRQCAFWEACEAEYGGKVKP